MKLLVFKIQNEKTLKFPFVFTISVQMTAKNRFSFYVRRRNIIHRVMTTTFIQCWRPSEASPRFMDFLNFGFKFTLMISALCNTAVYILSIRLHSSRMYTARLLTVSPGMHCAGEGVPAPRGGVPAPGVGGAPWSWGEGGMVSTHALRQTPPPWTKFLTHATENITLPQTSLAGGNRLFGEFLLMTKTTCINSYCTSNLVCIILLWDTLVG